MTTAITRIKDPTRRLFEFARERHAIYVRRTAGEEPPWTKDPVLRDYRFTNVYRDLDIVTQWIHYTWLYPNSRDPDVWFAMCLARLLNQPDTLKELGYPASWNRVHFLRTLRNRRMRGERIFNAAYIVSTNGVAEDKVVYLCDAVLDPLWRKRAQLQPKKSDTLQSYHVLLGQMQGFGSFMTAQVIADLKHVEPLKSASDWGTFAASGPGSRRGLNYVLGRDRRSPWTEEEWRLEHERLQEKLIPMFEEADMPVPDAQDSQNVLCEWSKYWRAATEGKMPKQRYRWKEEKSNE